MRDGDGPGRIARSRLRASLVLLAVFAACSVDDDPGAVRAADRDAVVEEGLASTTSSTSSSSATAGGPSTSGEPDSSTTSVAAPTSSAAPRTPTTATTTSKAAAAAPTTAPAPTTTVTTTTTAQTGTATVRVIWIGDEQSSMDLAFTHSTTGERFAVAAAKTELIPDITAGRWFIEAWGSTQTTQPDGTPLVGDAAARYVLDLATGTVTEITCRWDRCSGEHLTNRDHPDG